MQIGNIMIWSQEFLRWDFRMRIFCRICCNNAPIYCVIQDVGSNLQRNDRDIEDPLFHSAPSFSHPCLDRNMLSCIASISDSNFYHRNIWNLGDFLVL